MKKYSLFASVSVVSFIIDQLTKFYISSSMRLFESIPVINGFFSITYLRNKGAAFSVLSGTSWRLPFFITVTIIAIAAIFIMIRKTKEDRKIEIFSLSLIFSGAAGNLADRIRMGEVVDFLDVYWKSYHWPAFNVADSAICIGVFLMAIQMFSDDRKSA